MASTNINAVIKGYSRQKEEEQAKLVAQENHLPYINLMNYPFTGDVLGLLPRDIAKRFSIIAFERVGKRVKVATPFPFTPGLAEKMTELGIEKNLSFEPHYCSETSISYSLIQYERLVKQVEEIKAKAHQQSAEAFLKNIHSLQDLGGAIQSVNTTELFEMVLSGALAFDATDIHFEPDSQEVRLRFRIDGDLVEIAELSNSVYHLLLSRIKNLAGLKLNKLTSAQDGRFSIEVGNQTIDVRVNVLPASYGETVELRLLSAKGLLNLNELGLSTTTIDAIQRHINQENGMIILTGPTGSGKTTTLYAILELLNTENRKIITIEDPVEYKLAGIEQIQVDPAKGFDFAAALKAVLRQDPDVILVGEIRDKETAEIAIHASLTGHLVLTTIHSNSAAATFARLTDLGAPGNLLGDAISLIIAQRLVKRASPGNGVLARGRIAISEYLEPDEGVQNLIKNKAPISEFEKAFAAAGNKTLEQDLQEKVAQGLAIAEKSGGKN